MPSILQAPSRPIDASCIVTTGRVLCWISNGGHQLTLLDFSTRLFHRDLPVKTKLQGIIPTNFQSQPCILAWDFKGNIFIVDSTKGEFVDVSSLQTNMKEIFCAVVTRESPLEVLFALSGGMVLLWSRRLGVLGKLPIAKVAMTCAKLCPKDPDFVLLGCQNGNVFSLDLQTMQTELYLGHDHLVSDLTFQPDSDSEEILFASASYDATICIWSKAKGLLHQVPLPKKPGSYSNEHISLHWQSADRIIVSDYFGALFGLTVGEEVKVQELFQAHEGHVYTICASKRTRAHIFTQGVDGQICMWNIETEKRKWAYSCEGGCTNSVLETELGALILGSSHGIRLWDPKESEIICVPFHNVLDVKPHPDYDEFAAFGTSKGSVVFARLQDTHKYYNGQVAKHGKGVYEIEWILTNEPEDRDCLWGFKDEGWRILSIGGDGWIFQTNPLLKDFKPTRINTIISKANQLKDVPREFSGFAIHPSEKTIAIGTQKGRVSLYDIKTWKQLSTFHVQRGCIQRLRWSKDGTFLACGGRDHTVGIYNFTESDAFLLEGHQSSVSGVSWDPFDSTKFATCDYTGNIMIWDVFLRQRGRVIPFCKLQSNPLWSLTYSAFEEGVIYVASANGSGVCVDLNNPIWDVDKLQSQKKNHVQATVSFRDEDETFESVLEVAAKLMKNSLPTLKDGARQDLEANGWVVEGIEQSQLIYTNPKNYQELVEVSMQNDDESSCKPLKDDDIPLDVLLACFAKSSVKEVAFQFKSTNSPIDPLFLALAPSDREQWESNMLNQASRLVDTGEYDSAVCTYLALGEDYVHNAIDVYLQAGRDEDALALATYRLNQSDQHIKKIYHNMMEDASTLTCVKCYLAIGEYEKAVSLIEEEMNLEALRESLTLAEKLKNRIPEKFETLLGLLLVQCIIQSKPQETRSLLSKDPESRRFHILFRIFEITTSTMQDYFNNPKGNFQEKLADAFEAFQIPRDIHVGAFEELIRKSVERYGCPVQCRAAYLRLHFGVLYFQSQRDARIVKYKNFLRGQTEGYLSYVMKIPGSANMMRRNLLDCILKENEKDFNLSQVDFENLGNVELALFWVYGKRKERELGESFQEKLNASCESIPEFVRYCLPNLFWLDGDLENIFDKENNDEIMLDFDVGEPI